MNKCAKKNILTTIYVDQRFEVENSGVSCLSQTVLRTLTLTLSLWPRNSTWTIQKWIYCSQISSSLWYMTSRVQIVENSEEHNFWKYWKKQLLRDFQAHAPGLDLGQPEGADWTLEFLSTGSVISWIVEKTEKTPALKETFPIFIPQDGANSWTRHSVSRTYFSNKILLASGHSDQWSLSK